MLTFKRFITEMAVNLGGVVYEKKVHKAIIDANVQGLSPGAEVTAGFSSVGSGDIQAKYNNKEFNVEVKASRNDQMGGSSIRYDRKNGTFELVKDMDPEDAELLLAAAASKKNDINAYIDAVKKIEPVEYHKNVKGIPITITKNARNLLKDKGLLAKVNSNIVSDTSFIIKHYNKKNVYYIQIGGAGLFYMGKNPLKLPIPELQGTINIEMRLGFAGGKTKYIDTSGTSHDIRTAGLRIQGRLKTQGSSPYTLDDPESIKKLFSKLGYIDKSE